MMVPTEPRQKLSIIKMPFYFRTFLKITALQQTAMNDLWHRIKKGVQHSALWISKVKV